MAFRDFLERWFPTTETVGGETIIIDIPAELYYKELALYTGISLIANAISRSEIKTLQNEKEVKEHDYFLLNVSPNINESSSQFWHKVINKMIREKETLVVDLNDRLYCADSFSVKQERPILGNLYENVVLGELTLNRIFKADDVYLFRLEDVDVKRLIDGLYEEYGKVFKSAFSAYKKGNGSKYKIHIAGVRAGDKDFQTEFEDVIKKQLKDFMENENAVYPEFDGYDLQAGEKQSVRTADDIIKLRKEIFGIVGDVLKIPSTLMSGNITNMNEIVKVFLTFCIDPYADMITEVLNKRAGYDEWKEGNRYIVDSGKINHRDIFDLADAIEKIISSGFFCIDEAREELGKEPLNTPWSQQYWMTKNFQKIEDALKALLGGGEKSDE